jgi:hypothetical protein
LEKSNPIRERKRRDEEEKTLIEATTFCLKRTKIDKTISVTGFSRNGQNPSGQFVPRCYHFSHI